MELLSRDRNIQALIRFLNRVAQSGPEPEITFPVEQIRDSIAQLTAALQPNLPNAVRRRAMAAITEVQAQTKSGDILADCHRALTILAAAGVPASVTLPEPVHPEDSALAEAERSIQTR